jgi:hypothetical protein
MESLDFEAEAKKCGISVTEDAATSALPVQPVTPAQRGFVNLKSEESTSGITVDQVRFHAGNRLARFILIIISAVTLALLILFLIQVILGVDAIGFKPANIQDQKEIAALYSEITKAAAEQTIRIFQTIVTQALLPILTAVLGYIFARSENNKE